MNSIKLYADNICVAEVFQAYDDGLISAGALRELIADAQPILTTDSYQALYSANEIRAGILKRETNCPNCGAPITSHKCEYCGTVFDRDKEEQILQHEKDELLQKQFALAQARQTESILANLQTSVFVPSDMSIRQACQADQDTINRMQNQNLSASTNIYPYRITQPIMTKETWIEKFWKAVKNFGASLW